MFLPEGNVFKHLKQSMPEKEINELWGFLSSLSEREKN